MYIKSFLLVLLGCSLVLAQPIEESSEHRVARSILGTFAGWLNKADETVDSVYEKVKQPFKQVYDTLVQTGEGVADYSKEKVYQVLNKYYEIKSESEESLNKVKNQFLARLTSELQKVTDMLSKNIDSETLEKLKEKTKEIAKSGKDALEKLKAELEEAIKAQQQKLENELNKWEGEANEIVKEEH